MNKMDELREALDSIWMGNSIGLRQLAKFNGF
jgi:hypothetical protein